jgi:hypothetical protein
MEATFTAARRLSVRAYFDSFTYQFSSLSKEPGLLICTLILVVFSTDPIFFYLVPSLALLICWDLYRSLQLKDYLQIGIQNYIGLVKLSTWKSVKSLHLYFRADAVFALVKPAIMDWNFSNQTRLNYWKER